MRGPPPRTPGPLGGAARRARAALGCALSAGLGARAERPYGPAPRQRLDLWVPRGSAPPGGWPAVLFLHGGGWVRGDRGALQLQAPRLARRGVLAASAGYRLAPEHPWPAQRDDALAAIAQLITLQDFLVDPTRIVLWGVSAGGQLALMAAMALGPGRIRAVVTLGAPTNLTRWEEPDLRYTFRPDQLAAASPALQPAPLPPTLMLHGIWDRAVPLEQARAMSAWPEVELALVRGDHMLRLPPWAGAGPLRRARRWVAARLSA